MYCTVILLLHCIALIWIRLHSDSVLRSLFILCADMASWVGVGDPAGSLFRHRAMYYSIYHSLYPPTCQQTWAAMVQRLDLHQLPTCHKQSGQSSLSSQQSGRKKQLEFSRWFSKDPFHLTSRGGAPGGRAPLIRGFFLFFIFFFS